MERADARIVDEGVDPAERVDRAVDKVASGLRIGDIALNGHRAAAQCLDRRHRTIGTRLITRKVERDVGTVFGAPDRDRTADPCGRAGDQHDLAFEQHYPSPLSPSAQSAAAS